MNKYKLLVIDDRWNDRKDTYVNVLSEDFNLDYVDQASTLFDKIAQPDINAYLVDVVLSNWIGKKGPLELLEVLEAIGKEKPVILVSSAYKELVENDQLTDLFNKIIDYGYKVNSFLIWADFLLAKNNDPDRIKSIQNTIKINIKRHERVISNKQTRKFDLAVIGALSEEITPFTRHLQNLETEQKEKITYSFGELTTKNGKILRIITLYQEDMGTVDTAILGEFLLREFAVKVIALIGVCGGRDPIVGIGDIIIPNEIVAYQKGKITDKGLTLDIDIAKSSTNGRMTFATKCDDVLDKIHSEFVKGPLKQHHQMGPSIPKLFFDEMACGENVVSKEGELEAIAKLVNKPKLCAIDMETYALYRLNNFFEIKTLIVKSVMDLTTAKSDKYKTYAAFIAANFLKEVLYEEIWSI